MGPKREIKITDELRRSLEELPDKKVGPRCIQWTDEMNDILMKYWETKIQSDVARLLGVSSEVCRKQYRRLMREKEDGCSGEI